MGSDLDLNNVPNQGCDIKWRRQMIDVMFCLSFTPECSHHAVSQHQERMHSLVQWSGSQPFLGCDLISCSEYVCDPDINFCESASTQIVFTRSAGDINVLVNVITPLYHTLN